MTRAKLASVLAGLAVASILFVLIISGLGQAASTMYIRNNPSGGDCSAIGTWNATTLTCTLNTDLTFTGTNGIVISNDGITLDGNGHSLTGSGTATGIYIKGKTQVTIQNLTVSNFTYGIDMAAGNVQNVVQYNVFTGNQYGVQFASASSNTLYRNTISNNTVYGLYLQGSNNNTVYQNNFLSNASHASGTGNNIFNLPAPDGGNHWDTWTTPDANGDGFVDNPYQPNGMVDNLPFVSPDGWIDVTAPVVSNVQPSGTILTPTATISADYSDTGTYSTGIDTSSVTVSLDGATLSGCTVTAAGVSCAVSGLAYGSHTIGGSVSDNQGNTSPISGSFLVGDNTAPSVSNVQPTGTIYTSGTTLSADYADGGSTPSGIDTSSVSVTLDGVTVAGCTVTASGVSCPVSGMAPGAHTIGGSVSDVAGNTTPISGSFDVADNTAPVVSNVLPTGTIMTESTTISADYSDAADVSTGIDLSSVNVTLDGITVTGCTITASGVDCPVSGLAYGPHTIGGSVSDNSGNTSPISGSFAVGDGDAPAVSNVQPSGTIYTPSATVSADYADGGSTPSGIDTSSVSVTLDGNTLSGCTITAGDVSCPVSGLVYGSHTIGGSVSDLAGNTSTISGSFFVGDSDAPTVSNIQPSGIIYSDSPTLSADFSDGGATPSGINTASVSVTLDGSAVAGCTVTAAGVSCPVSGLSYGSHSIGGSVSDNAGNTSPISGSFFVGDNVAPTVSNVQPTGSINTSSTTLSAEYIDAGTAPSGIDVSSVSVTLDGAQVTGCTVTASGVSCPVSGLVYGSHTIGGSVSDNAGNTSPISGTFNVGDNIAPTVSNVQPSGTILTPSASIGADYNDAGDVSSGIDTASVSVTLDGNPLGGCTVTAGNVSCPVSGLVYGSHTIGGSVSDLAGNTSTISGSFFVGDSDAPVVSNVQPSGTIYNGAPTLSADFSDGGATPSGINTASVSVTLDGGPVTTCTVTAAGISCPVSGLSYGSHLIGGSVSDNAGNSTPISGSFFVGDTGAPAVGNVQPAGTISTSSTTVSADYGDTGEVLSGIDTSSVSVTLDGTTLSSCTVTAAGVSCPVSGLAYGPHTIGGSVSDNAGNTSPISGSFNVGDNQGPQVSGVAPTGTIYSSSTTLSASYSDPGDVSSGINTSSVTVTLDSIAVSGCTVTASGVSCPVSALGFGTHTIGGSVSDNAGNSSLISGTFMVSDNVAPTVSNVLPAGTIFSSTATISADFADGGNPASGIDAGSVTVTLDGAAISGCTAEASGVNCLVTGLAYGAHTIGGSVSDNAGNTSAISGSFTVGDNTPPSVSGVSPAGYIYTTSTDVSAMFSDSGSGIDTTSVSVTLDGLAVGGCAVTAGGVNCPISGLSYGTHTIGGTVSDNDGNSAPISGSFTVGDNVAPSVTAVSPSGVIYEFDADITASYGDTGTGIDTASVFLTLDGNPLSGCTVTSTSISCPATGMANGLHTIGGSVSDIAGNATPISGSFSVGDNIAPEVSSVTPSGTIFATETDVAASYSDTGSGIDTASASLTMDGAPLSGCAVTESGITCHATGLAYGPHTIGGSVSDSAGNSTAISGSFLVGDESAPVVNSVLPSGVIYSTSTTLSATYADTGDPASGIDTASVRLSLDGVNLGGCTATATGISCPVSGVAYGSHTIGGTVSDNAGNSTPISGSFSVGDNIAPNVSGVSPTGTIYTGETDISANYSDTRSGIDTASVSVTLDGNPLSGCTVTAANVSCPVTGLAYGPHTIGGSVSDNDGNTSAIGGSFNVGDNIAPSVDSVGPSGTIFTPDTEITAIYSDGGSGIDTSSVLMKMDGVTLSGCTVTAAGASCPVTGITYGAHNITGTVKDNAGNATPISGSFYMDDNVAPAVTSVGPSGNIYNTSAVVNAVYSDSGSGIDAGSVVVTLDGATLSGCTVTAGGVSCAVSGLTLGGHAIGGSVADNLGNTTVISGGFTVADNIAPTVSNVLPVGVTYAPDTTISADYADMGSPSSGIDTASVSMTLDGNPVSGCAVTGSHVSCDVTGLGYGTHIIGGSVSDNSGNASAISGSFSVGDNVAPTVSNVEPSGFVHSPSTTVAVDYFDADTGIDTASVSVTLDGATLNGCTVSAAAVSCPVADLSYGDHTIGGSVSDNAGNSAPISGSFSVAEDGAPVVSNVQPGGTIYTSSATISADYVDTGTPTSGIKTSSVVVKVDGVTLGGCNVTATGVSCAKSGLAVGSHTISGSVSDNAGNSTPISGSFAVADNQPPALAYGGPAAPTSNTSPTITATFADPAPSGGVDTTSAGVWLNGGGKIPCAVSGNTISCPVGPLADGQYSAHVGIDDNSGNHGFVIGSFSVDNAGPTVSSVRPAGIIISPNPLLTVQYSDSLSGINKTSVVVTLDGVALTNCMPMDNEVNCEAAGLADGLHVIGGSIADNLGNSTAINGSFTVKQLPPDPPPSNSDVSPHGGYSTTTNGIAGTDYCLQCHDVHDAAGDYVLMREATVTETCATCHSLFGDTADGTWTVAPPDLKDGINATASQYSAYKITGDNRVSGHRLGVSLNGEPVNNSNSIPGNSSTSLRVIKSSDYEEGEKYNNEPASTYRSTQGLYCASCHTVHADPIGLDNDGNGIPDEPKPKDAGNFGRHLVKDDSLNPDGSEKSSPDHVFSWSLLSNRPNHNPLAVSPSDPIGAYNAFCVACHEERDDQSFADPENNTVHNHPPLCVTCHYRDAADFPHTSDQNALLQYSSDKMCTTCHGQNVPGGPLP